MEIIAPESAQKTRLDVFLTEHVGTVSRSFVEKLCAAGSVTVNGQLEPPKYKLRAGDKIVVDYDFTAAKEVPDIDLPVMYEDDNCIVINKPAGILTHSKGVFNPEATVATFIADKISEQAGDRAGIVHRLDRATSGVILCAKTPEALTWFQKQFSSRKVKKTYFAVIRGTLEPAKAIIDVPIGRNPRNPKMFYATIHGKQAITQYEVVQTGPNYTLVRLMPQTGRTHQLRVHLLHMKHPIIGDDFYGGEVADRLYLHATELEITLPGGTRTVFTAPLPTSFKEKVEE